MQRDYQKTNVNFLISFIAGLSFITSFNLNASCGIDVIAAFCAMNYILISSNRSFANGYIFGLGYFGGTLYWIAESFKCVGLGNMGYPAVACLVLYLSIYPGLAFYLTKRYSYDDLSRAIYFASFWMISEFLRGIVFTGFPWNLMAYVSVNYPYFPQIADLMGSYGGSFLIFLISMLFVPKEYWKSGIKIALFVPPGWDPIGSYGVSFLIVLISMLLVSKEYWRSGIKLALCVIAYGAIKESLPNKPIIGHESCITIVQPSISQIDKMNHNRFSANLNQHIILSDLKRKSDKTRLVVWPEAAVSLNQTNESETLEYISSFVRSEKTYVLFGCDHFENGRLYNGAYLIKNRGEVLQKYDKRHLLPFGEFIPEFLRYLGLGKITDGTINFSRGSKPRTFRLSGFEEFELVICYEAVFPREICDSKKSGWILNITNDAWFGNTPGPIQHLNSVRFRAIEEQRPIIRVANNGISCIIDSNGKILKKLETNEIGTIDYQ